jgi:hypothetical protein
VGPRVRIRLAPAESQQTLGPARRERSPKADERSFSFRWDGEFESGFLQRRVCKLSVPLETLTASLHRTSASAVIRNPFAGQFVEDLRPLAEAGAMLGERLMPELVKLLDGLKIMLKTERASLVLTPLNPLEDHQCSLLWTGS